MKKAKYTALLDFCKDKGWHTWLFPRRRLLFPVQVQTDASSEIYWQECKRDIEGLSQTPEQASSRLWPRQEEKS